VSDDTEIIRLLAAGWSDEEIATRLGVSGKTIQRKRRAVREQASAGPAPTSVTVHIDAVIDSATGRVVEVRPAPGQAGFTPAEVPA
jgi:hypothetical protein